MEHLETDILCKLQQRIHHKTAAWLIIDEISCVTSEMFGQIDHRLRQIMGRTDLAFGGLSVLIMGDMFQLPPVIGKAMYTDVIEHALMTKEPKGKKIRPVFLPGKPKFVGVELFKKFGKIELKQQMRAADDVQHSALLFQMRYPEPGEPRIPINFSTRFKILTAADVLNDPSWAQTEIITTNNNERFNINKFQSTAFAQQQQQAHFSWPSKINNISDPQLLAYYYKEYPALINYFVKGAPGYIIEKINPGINLANGPKVILESIIIDDRDDPDAIQTRLTTEISPSIILKHPPQGILVSVPGADIARFSTMTMEPGAVVIPIGLVRRAKDLKGARIKNGVKRDLYYLPHNVDIGFAVTVHKVQGQTCSKIILDLNYRPFNPQLDFHSVIVMVSRVRTDENIRVMPPHPNGPSLDYLNKLEPKPELVIWLEGFYENEPAEDGLVYWCAPRAQTAYNNVFKTQLQKENNRKRKRVTTSSPQQHQQPQNISFADFMQSLQ